MINISNPNGIFSKIRNAFTSSRSSSVTDDNFNIGTTVSNSEVEETAFFASSTDDLIPSNTNLNDEDLSIPLENHAEASTKDNSTTCLSGLDYEINNYSTTGKRKVLFKIEKYKFDYPVSKTTKLYYYPNLPIIQSLEYTTKTKHDNSQTTTILCNNVQVTIPIEYDYEEITFKPYVSYSIALYNQKTPNPSTSASDINNLDLYALENDSLFLTPFTMCFPRLNRNFSPSDFIVTVSVTDPLGGSVSPVYVFDDYYLYEVDVNIELTLAPAIDLSSININTLDVLNSQLGKPAGNTLFTQYELNSVTHINYSGFNGLSTLEYSDINLLKLDYNIFRYLPNLVCLDISSTNANVNTASNFELLNNLKNLKILIAKNNYFTDYSAFSLLTNLINPLTNLDLNNEQPVANNITTLAAPPIDISPLTIFTSLTSLGLSGNNLTSLPTSVSNLSSLTSLNLSNNILNTLPSEFSSLGNLVTLDLSGNSISDLSVIATFTNLETLNISGNPVDPNTIDNLPVIDLDYSYSNLDNQSLLTLKFSNKLERLNISGNHISDLTSLSEYNFEILATDQYINYGLLEPVEFPAYILDLGTFLLDTDFDVPCIDYISNDGTCGPVESCDCVSIVWFNIDTSEYVYFTFSNVTDTFTGKVVVEPIAPLE